MTTISESITENSSTLFISVFSCIILISSVISFIKNGFKLTSPVFLIFQMCIFGYITIYPQSLINLVMMMSDSFGR